MLRLRDVRDSSLARVHGTTSSSGRAGRNSALPAVLPQHAIVGGWDGTVIAAVEGGLVAATLDVFAACLINQRSVAFVLHSIAGGLLAARSFEGGMPSAFLGLALQELMGILIAMIYGFGGRVMPRLRKHWVLCGIAYGVVVFFVMNYVVVPLSAWHRLPQFSVSRFFGNLAAMLLFGLIVAFFAQGRSK